MELYGLILLDLSMSLVPHALALYVLAPYVQIMHTCHDLFYFSQVNILLQHQFFVQHVLLLVHPFLTSAFATHLRPALIHHLCATSSSSSQGDSRSMVGTPTCVPPYPSICWKSLWQTTVLTSSAACARAVLQLAFWSLKRSSPPRSRRIIFTLCGSPAVSGMEVSVAGGRASAKKASMRKDFIDSAAKITAHKRQLDDPEDPGF